MVENQTLEDGHGALNHVLILMGSVEVVDMKEAKEVKVVDDKMTRMVERGTIRWS
jgi:hypothetical protein